MIRKSYSRLLLAASIIFVMVVSAPNVKLTGEPASGLSVAASRTSTNPPTTQMSFDPGNQLASLLGHSPYYFGDGYDYDALEWINSLEAHNSFAELSSMPEVTAAIIDSGIDPDVWKYIEDNGGDIVYYVKYQAFYRWHWWPPGYWFDIEGPYEAATYDDADVWDGYGHGSMTASTVWQVAPKAKLLIIDVYDDEGDTALQELAVERALQWLISHQGSYDVDVVSMSFGSSSEADCDAFHDEITTLHNNYGVAFFASSGNYPQHPNERSNIYPASWSEVISVGAIFDEWDSLLTDGNPFNPDYRGYRVACSKTDDYRPPEWTWASVYGDYIDFVAPGFDVEVLDYNSEGLQGSSDVVYGVNDGTSFACPFAAGIAALAVDAFYDNHLEYDPMAKTWYTYEPTPIQVFDFLKWSAETRVYTVDYPPQERVTEYTPHPTAGGQTYPHSPFWGQYIGWGCVDAYDAVLQATI